jgi:hypothetical protein
MRYLIAVIAAVAIAWTLSLFVPSVHQQAFTFNGTSVQWATCLFFGLTTLFILAVRAKRGR